MTGLFHVNHRTVLAHSLKRLTEDRVQWLLENFLLIEERQVMGHNELHTFKRVLNRGSLVQKDYLCALQRRHEL